MPTNTYTPIATTTLTSSSADITFSSIGSYNDLVLEVTAYGSVGSAWGLRVNGDSGNNYTNTRLYTYNNVVSTFRSTPTTFFAQGGILGLDTTFPYHATFNIVQPSYQSYPRRVIATFNHWNGTNGGSDISHGTWSSSAAITSVTINSGSGAFLAGTTATLFGLG